MITSSKFFWLLYIFFPVDCLQFLEKSQQNATLQITTNSGTIQGRERRTMKKNIYFSYEGIPFAQPPINNLRFKEPKPAKRWKGVLDASKPGPPCIGIGLRFIEIEIDGYEDCLYINVYTPTNLKISKNDPLPVIFWIYGGAFIEGEASSYGPGHLLDANLVVVTFNYRLGVFGFLSTQDAACPGNYGLKDQNLALHWVNKNINKFGGDPSKITISGHSAGASSVIHQMLSPKSRGLFSQAIAWSGETTSVWSNQESPRDVATDLAIYLGIESDNTTLIVEKMRKLNAEDLTMAEINVILLRGANILRDGLIFTPTIEPDHPSAFITESTSELMKRGDFSRVPLMIGTTNTEVGLFMRIFSLLRPALVLFDISLGSLPNGVRPFPTMVQNRKIGGMIRNEYIKSKTFATATTEEVAEFLTDLLYTKPIMNTVKAMSPFIPIYLFITTHSEKMAKNLLNLLKYPIDTQLKGVVHGEDLTLIWYYKNFGTPPGSSVIQKKFLRMWANFAATGNPTPTVDGKLGNLTWPSVTDNGNISHLLIRDDLEIGYNYRKSNLDFWDRVDDFVKK